MSGFKHGEVLKHFVNGGPKWGLVTFDCAIVDPACAQCIDTNGVTLQILKKNLCPLLPSVEGKEQKRIPGLTGRRMCIANTAHGQRTFIN